MAHKAAVGQIFLPVLVHTQRCVQTQLQYSVMLQLWWRHDIGNVIVKIKFQLYKSSGLGALVTETFFSS
jgi:hypothetical protein